MLIRSRGRTTHNLLSSSLLITSQCSHLTPHSSHLTSHLTPHSSLLTYNLLRTYICIHLHTNHTIPISSKPANHTELADVRSHERITKCNFTLMLTLLTFIIINFQYLFVFRSRSSLLLLYGCTYNPYTYNSYIPVDIHTLIHSYIHVHVCSSILTHTCPYSSILAHTILAHICPYLPILVHTRPYLSLYLLIIYQKQLKPLKP